MKINYQEDKSICKVGDLFAGDVFISKNRNLYIRTDRINDGKILCVDVKDGYCIDFRRNLPVSKVAAEITILTPITGAITEKETEEKQDEY